MIDALRTVGSQKTLIVGTADQRRFGGRTPIVTSHGKIRGDPQTLSRCRRTPSL
jgi:hypothetical protein